MNFQLQNLKITKTSQSNNPNEMQLIIPSTASLPLTQDHNSDSEQSQSELQLSPTYRNRSDHK